MTWRRMAELSTQVTKSSSVRETRKAGSLTSSVPTRTCPWSMSSVAFFTFSDILSLTKRRNCGYVNKPKEISKCRALTSDHDDGKSSPTEAARRDLHRIVQIPFGRDQPKDVQLLQQLGAGLRAERIRCVHVAYLLGQIADVPGEFIVSKTRCGKC